MSLGAPRAFMFQRSCDQDGTCTRESGGTSSWSDLLPLWTDPFGPALPHVASTPEARERFFSPPPSGGRPTPTVQYISQPMPPGATGATPLPSPTPQPYTPPAPGSDWPIAPQAFAPGAGTSPSTGIAPTPQPTPAGSLWPVLAGAAALLWFLK